MSKLLIKFKPVRRRKRTFTLDQKLMPRIMSKKYILLKLDKTESLKQNSKLRKFMFFTFF